YSDGADYHLAHPPPARGRGHPLQPPPPAGWQVRARRAGDLPGGLPGGRPPREPPVARAALVPGVLFGLPLSPRDRPRRAGAGGAAELGPAGVPRAVFIAGGGAALAPG